MALNHVKASRSGFEALRRPGTQDSLTKRAQTREQKKLVELLHEGPGADLPFGDERSSFTQVKQVIIIAKILSGQERATIVYYLYPIYGCVLWLSSRISCVTGHVNCDNLYYVLSARKSLLRTQDGQGVMPGLKWHGEYLPCGLVA